MANVSNMRLHALQTAQVRDMSIQTQHNHHWFKSFLLSSLMTPLFAFAAPGTISDVPLFTVNSVESNIFFMLDDSGSMDLEIMTSELDPASNGWDGSLVTTGRDYRYTTPDVVDHNATKYFTPKETDVPNYGLWRSRNHHYNHIYYNPSVTYEPWVGVDSAGNPYKKYSASNVADITTPRST
jgi:type IV pilus assembly protein PilY1